RPGRDRHDAVDGAARPLAVRRRRTPPLRRRHRDRDGRPDAARPRAPRRDENQMNGLVASGVVVRFGGLVALDGVDVEAVPGRITGLIGPNGAGKTTMFNVICGFQAPAAGTVTLDGADITGYSPAHRARMGLGRTFQRMELFRSLTVRENVALAAEAAHIGDDPLTQLGIVRGGRRVRREVAEATEELLTATGLGPVADRLAGEISTG